MSIRDYIFILQYLRQNCVIHQRNFKTIKKKRRFHRSRHVSSLYVSLWIRKVQVIMTLQNTYRDEYEIAILDQTIEYLKE